MRSSATRSTSPSASRSRSAAKGWLRTRAPAPGSPLPKRASRAPGSKSPPRHAAPTSKPSSPNRARSSRGRRSTSPPGSSPRRSRGCALVRPRTSICGSPGWTRRRLRGSCSLCAPPRRPRWPRSPRSPNGRSAAVIWPRTRSRPPRNPVLGPRMNVPTCAPRGSRSTLRRPPSHANEPPRCRR